MPESRTSRPATGQAAGCYPEPMADAPEDWLALAPGSDEELIANFLRGAAARRFRHLCALRDTILSASRQSREPAVVSVRLEWWREELGRLAAGEARHPLTRGLQALLPDGSPLIPWLEETVIAAESLARLERPDSRDELRLLCFRTEGATLTLAAVSASGLHGDDEAARAAAKHAGVAWSLARTIASLAEGRNLHLLPRDLARRHGLGDLSRGDTRGSEGFDAAIRELALFGLEELDRLPADPPGAAAAMVAAVSRAHLTARRRSATRRAHPLQLLWCAWRAARRHARHHPPAKPREQP